MRTKKFIIVLLIISVCSLLSISTIGLAAYTQKEAEALELDKNSSWQCELEYYSVWAVTDYEPNLTVYRWKNKDYGTLTVSDLNNWLAQGDRTKSKGSIKEGTTDFENMFKMYKYGWRITGFIAVDNYEFGGQTLVKDSFYTSINIRQYGLLDIATPNFRIVFDDGLGFQYKATEGYPRHKGTKSAINYSVDISSTSQWEQLAKNCSVVSFSNQTYFEYAGCTFNLTKDLNFSYKSIRPVGIGLSDDGASNGEEYYLFRGTVDGKGHTISNAVIEDNANYKYGPLSGLGLFGKMIDGVIKNLRLYNITVKGMAYHMTQQGVIKYYYLNYKNIGVLIGTANGTNVNNCQIENCKIDVSCTRTDYTKQNAEHGIGGLVGGLSGQKGAYGTIAIVDCLVDVDIKVNLTNWPLNVAGVVGRGKHFAVNSCMVKVGLDVNAASTKCFVAGIAVYGIGGDSTTKPSIADSVVVIKSGSSISPASSHNRGDITDGGNFYNVYSPIWAYGKSGLVTCEDCYYDDKSSIKWTDTLGGTAKTIS